LTILEILRVKKDMIRPTVKRGFLYFPYYLEKMLRGTINTLSPKQR